MDEAEPLRQTEEPCQPAGGDLLQPTREHDVELDERRNTLLEQLLVVRARRQAEVTDER